MSRKQDCSTCYYNNKVECPIPFMLQGQLSSTGTFYCPSWVDEEEIK